MASSRRRLEQISAAVVADGGTTDLEDPTVTDQVQTATATEVDAAAEILRGLDASELLPAPHHTPLQTPEEARARQAVLAGTLDRTLLLQLHEGMLRVEAFERTLEKHYFAGKLAGPLHLCESRHFEMNSSVCSFSCFPA